MSADWYYMSSGWIRKTKRVGPITEPELLARIDDGRILPHTLVQSVKTKGKWIPMSLVEPAMDRYKALLAKSEKQP